MPTNKGKLAGAKAGEFNNLIRAAFEVRCISPIMPRPKIDDDGFVVIEDVDEEEEVIVGGNVDGNDEEEGDANNGDPPRLIVESPHRQNATITPPRRLLSGHLPSYFLSSEPYLQLANTSIHGVIQKETNTVREDIKDHADKMMKVLRRRLSKHIRTKIPDESKHSHPALLFVKVNLNRFVALLCYFDQARTNTIMHTNACLLQHHLHGGFVVAEDSELEGSYVHYLTDDCKLIRSGEAVCSNATKNGIVKRNEEGHRKKAASASVLDGECFYTLYSSRDNTNQLTDKRGYFENLKQYCGFCFKRNGNVEPLVSIVEGESLFDWSVYIRSLEKANIRGSSTLKEKQLAVVGYFF